MTKSDPINRLNNSKLDDKGHHEYEFGANKTPVEVIKGGAFKRTYFRAIYCGINKIWYRKSWKEFDEFKNIDKKCYCSNMMMLM